MTIRLTPAQEQSLEGLAQATGRSANDVFEEAITWYLDGIEAASKELREAEAEADRDGWLSTDEVFARLNHNLPKTA